MTSTIIFKTRLKPTRAQEAALKQCCGAARYTYNSLLASFRAEEETNRTLPKDQRSYTKKDAYSLRKLWKSLRPAWSSEVSGDAFDSGIIAISAAYQAYLSGRASHPKFKKREGAQASSFGTNSRLRHSGKAVHLSRVGEVRLSEKLAAADWLVRSGGKLTGVAVAREGGRWVASLRLKLPDALYKSYLRGLHYKNSGKTVGLDLGLKEYVTTSDAVVVANPRFGKKQAERVARLQRQYSRQAEAAKKTGRKRKSKRQQAVQARLQKAHGRTVRQREAFTHALSRALVDGYSLVAVEDLNITGMLKNRRLAKSISDASWASFLGKLSYKLERSGGELRKAARFYPSSKTCSGCGAVKAKLPLSERVYHCEQCGFTADRDLNAALNIRACCFSTPQGYGGVSGQDGREFALSCRSRLGETGGEPTARQLTVGALPPAMPTGSRSSGTTAGRVSLAAPGRTRSARALPEHP